MNNSELEKKINCIVSELVNHNELTPGAQHIGGQIMIINTTSAWAKIVSGLLVAVGSGISESLGMIAVSGHVIWPVFFKVVGGILLTYIVTTFLAPPAAQSKQIKRFTLIKQAA